MRRGQSIIEIITAVSIGVILVTGAVAIIVPALRNNTNVSQAQASAALGKELMENLKVLAQSDWSAISTLATTSENKYYLTAGSPYATATGTESVAVATTTYTRYFYLDSVYRNGSGKIADSGTVDPSARKVTVVYTWPPAASSSLVSYIARSSSGVFTQSDWSSGAGTEGPLTATATVSSFSTSTNIEYVASSGAVYISGIP